jgi:hypothetical protein
MDDRELERKIKELAKWKWEEVKNGLEIVMRDWRINIKDPACKAFSMTIAFQDIIGDVSVEPHAALAWTGVVTILPVSVMLPSLQEILTFAFQLLLNPVKQTNDKEGLNNIADLLVRYRLVEEAYSEEIEDTKRYFV